MSYRLMYTRPTLFINMVVKDYLLKTLNYSPKSTCTLKSGTFAVKNGTFANKSGTFKTVTYNFQTDMFCIKGGIIVIKSSTFTLADLQCNIIVRDCSLCVNKL